MPTLLTLTSAHDAEIVQRRVETPEEAEDVRFLGSPSVESMATTSNPVLRAAPATA
jgi:hypothetical protein